MTLLLRLYNTLTRQVEDLVPGADGKVRVYACGPTVYDVPHAGHARAALAPDILVRRLLSKGVEVTYVRNITDVDDKILERAHKNGEEPLALSRRMATVYQDQMRAVGCLNPTHEPRVSDHLKEIFDIVETLIQRGSAYVVDMPEGKRDVYFAVRSFPDYGKLSRRRIDELLVGARVERDDTKRDPLDFALWKGAAAGEWGWDSPWGRGRPGWHIECSAMCTKYLGQGFEVHAGGMDLIFPHHENEIAQSEAAYPEAGPLAKLWMHNGFINVDKEKMSKSLGNFVTVSDILERNDAEGLRWFLLSAHYRGPVQFESEQLEGGRVVFPNVDEAERRVDYLFTTQQRLRELGTVGEPVPGSKPPELKKYTAELEKAEISFGTALDDDLNTPVALAAIGEIVRIGNELCDLAQKRRKDAAFVAQAALFASELLAALKRTSDVLGLLQANSDAYFERTRARRLKLRGLEAQDIDAKVAARRAARAAKDFRLGDALRDELSALGIRLKDTPTSTEWFIDQ